MIIRILNILLAFLTGIIGFGILFLIFKFIIRISGISPLEYSFIFSGHLTKASFNGLYEELGKYLSIKSWKIENPNSIFLGLGWGGIEAFTWHFTGKAHLINRITPTILQIITAMIICYFIKRKKPILGLLAAIIIHTGYDFILTTMES